MAASVIMFKPFLKRCIICLMGHNIIKEMLRDMKIELPFVVVMYRSKLNSG